MHWRWRSKLERNLSERLKCVASNFEAGCGIGTQGKTRGSEPHPVQGDSTALGIASRRPFKMLSRFAFDRRQRFRSNSNAHRHPNDISFLMNKRISSNPSCSDYLASRFSALAASRGRIVGVTGNYQLNTLSRNYLLGGNFRIGGNTFESRLGTVAVAAHSASKN